MRIVGIDTNSFYLATATIENGRWVMSTILPTDGVERKADHKKKAGSRNKLYENLSARERLDSMIDFLDAALTVWPEAYMPDYVYIEEPPYVNNAKTYAELTAVVMVTREIFRRRQVPCSLVNVMTWKRETTGNAKADKTEVQQWAIAHIPGFPSGLTEDEADAAVIAWRGAVAAGDVHG